MHVSSYIVKVILVGLFSVLSSTAFSAPINIESGKFYALALPSPGVGPSSPESKHMTWAYNPNDQRLYHIGGDFDSGDGATRPQSYRQDQYSLSLVERWADKANRNAGWRLEYPYCGPDGGVQPKSPDFVGWVWDSLRKVFWFVPGTSVIPVAAVCGDRTVSTSSDAKYLFNHLMTYDPSQTVLTKRWTDYGQDTTPWRAEKWMSVYDPVNDNIIRFGSNEAVDIYDIQSGTWESFKLAHGLPRTVRIFGEMLAVDLESRFIYAIDWYAARLMRWNMDTRKLDDLGAVPDGPLSAQGNAYLVWDSNNKVLMFFHLDTKRFHVYHPNTNQWETPAINTVDYNGNPIALKPDVAHSMVFDPNANVVAFLGSRDKANPMMYLYRYGDGNGSNNPSPSAPTGLTPQ